MTPGMLTMALVRRDQHRRAMEAAAPFAGVYRVTAPNGEVVEAELIIDQRNTMPRAWRICGRVFSDGQLAGGWKIGQRVSGPGFRGEAQ